MADIKLELLTGEIADIMIRSAFRLEIDENKLIEGRAVKILREIKEIVNDKKLNDFMAMEEIVCIFENYNIDAGMRHDY